VVKLAHVPDTSHRRAHQSGQVEAGKGDYGTPGKGVANATIEGIWAVLVEAEDVRAGLGAGQFAAQAGNTGADEHRRQPKAVPAVESVSEEREGQRTGGEKEDPYPDGPVSQPVTRGIPLADLAFLGKFHFSAILHCPEFLKLRVRASIDCAALGQAPGDLAIA
jgi:hypothetical protein